MSHLSMAEQIAAAQAAGNLSVAGNDSPAKKQTPAVKPAVEFNMDKLLSGLPDPESFLPREKVEEVSQVSLRLRALAEQVPTIIRRYSEPYWRIRAQGPAACAAAGEGFEDLGKFLFEVLLNGSLPLPEGEPPLNDDEASYLANIARTKYARVALELIPNDREIFLGHVGDLMTIKPDGLHGMGFFISVSREDAKEKGATFFGSYAVVLNEDTPESHDILLALVAKWNHIKSRESRGFYGRKGDLLQKFRSSAEDKISVEELIDGKAGTFFFFAKDHRPQTAVIGVSDGEIIRLTGVVSTDPKFERKILEIVSKETGLAVHQISHSRLELKSHVTPDLFGKLMAMHRLLKAGIENEKRRVRVADETSTLQKGVSDLVRWFDEAPAGATAVNFRPWREKPLGEEEKSFYFSARFTRMEEGKGSPIVLEAVAPRNVLGYFPLLREIVGATFTPTGGPKFEGNVRGKDDKPTSVEAAGLFRRLLNVGFGISRKVKANRERDGKPVYGEAVSAESDSENGKPSVEVEVSSTESKRFRGKKAEGIAADEAAKRGVTVDELLETIGLNEKSNISAPQLRKALATASNEAEPVATA